MRLINSDSNNWIVEYFTAYMTSDGGTCHVVLKIDTACHRSACSFLSMQLLLFWHICESCCFNCTRHWQVYSLSAGVWCPQVSVPSRGHVGTSQMSSWLKEENSSVLYAQLHFVALGQNLIALPFRVSSLKDALVLTAVFTEAVLSVENPTWDVQESVILHNVQLSLIFVPLVLFFSPFVPRRQYNWL